MVCFGGPSAMTYQGPHGSNPHGSTSESKLYSI